MRRIDIAELLFLAALWGGSFLFTRYSVPEFGPFALIGVRVGTAALFLIPVLFLRGAANDFGENWFRACAVGVFSSAVPFVLMAYAMISLSSGYASILNATTPIWGAIVAYIWLKDRLELGKLIGLMVGVLGVTILVWGKLDFSYGGGGWPIAAMIGGTLMYAISASFTKRYLSKVNPLAVATGSQIGATLVLLPLVIAYWPEQSISTEAWISALLLGVICTGFAFILFFRLMANVGPANTMTVTFLIPFFAMLWGSIALDETITLRMLSGGAVIFFGTALATGVVKLPGRKAGKVAL